MRHPGGKTITGTELFAEILNRREWRKGGEVRSRVRKYLIVCLSWLHSRYGPLLLENLAGSESYAPAARLGGRVGDAPGPCPSRCNRSIVARRRLFGQKSSKIT